MKNFITQLFNEKRFRALLWQAAMMLLAFIVDFALQNLAGFGLPLWATTSLGLLLMQVSKAIHNALGTPTE